MLEVIVILMLIVILSPAAVFGAILGIMIYFLPTLIAHEKKSKIGLIFVVNLFVGWSVIGWVVCLLWALSEPKQGEVPK